MSATEVPSSATSGASVGRADMKLEAVVIPVSDVDRAKEFYESLGWRLDADFSFDNGFRVVQFTPPGSGCSVQFGTNMTSAAPGSAQGLYLIVSDIDAARDDLVAHGVDASEVFHAETPGAAVPARRHERSRERARARSRQLQLLRHVQRPGRQRLAAAGDHEPTARPDRRRSDGIRIHRRPGERASACGGRARRAREAHRAARRELAGVVRRVHAWRSRPATSFRRDRLRRHRPRRRRARRALRRRAGGGRSARRRRRTRARGWRVLLLGVHPVQDPASPG